MSKYYIYINTDSDGFIFYVGKGCKSRRTISNTNTRSNLYIKYTKNKTYFTDILCYCSSEEEALMLEIMAISYYGRLDLGTGCLINQTDGGIGSHGRVVSSNTKNLISKANKGRKFSSKTKKVMSINNSGSGNPNAKKVRCLSNGMIFNTMQEASEWAVGHKKGNHNISAVCTGNLKTAYGHRWEYV